jgi:hypothetical protein
MSSGFVGCPGLCTCNVPGVGFKVSCAPDTNTTWNMDVYSGGITKPQFHANTTWRAQMSDGEEVIAANGSKEYLTLSAGWAINTGTPLLFVNRVCNLSLAVVSYPLKIVDSTVSLTLPSKTDPEVLYDLPTASTAPRYRSRRIDYSRRIQPHWECKRFWRISYRRTILCKCVYGCKWCRCTLQLIWHKRFYVVPCHQS